VKMTITPGAIISLKLASVEIAIHLVGLFSGGLAANCLFTS
jgi:hypothetical protein